MKKILIISIMLFSITLVFSQARMVLNNDAFLVIDGGANLVLANANTNALTVIGTGGNIISEDETDVIKWEIGTTTGTYVIPWTTYSGVKIPLSINKTTTGTGVTVEFILSTWETADDNQPWAFGVTNMNLPSAADGSLFAMDRYWHMDASSFTVKPDVTLTINYDPSEIGGSNTIAESNLLAQRFNTGTGNWESFNLFGTNDAGNDRITGIVVPSADFYTDWILVDNTNALPVELISFEVDCKDGRSIIDWTTQTEINNDYFVVEKSYDAVTFFELTIIQGAGNSNIANFYSVIDPNPSSGTTYYRLKQVDFDGATSYHNIKSSSCNESGFDVNQIVLNDNTLSFNIANSLDEKIVIYFYDYRGRLISNKIEMVTDGNNAIKLTNLNLSTGIYLLSIAGEYNTYSTKLMSKRE